MTSGKDQLVVDDLLVFASFLRLWLSQVHDFHKFTGLVKVIGFVKVTCNATGLGVAFHC